MVSFLDITIFIHKKSKNKREYSLGEENTKENFGKVLRKTTSYQTKLV